MENQQAVEVRVQQINATKVMLGISIVVAMCVGVAFGIIDNE